MFFFQKNLKGKEFSRLSNKLVGDWSKLKNENVQGLGFKKEFKKFFKETNKFKIK